MNVIILQANLGEPWFRLSIYLAIIGGLLYAVIDDRENIPYISIYAFGISLIIFFIGFIDALAYTFSQPILWDHPIENARLQMQAANTAFRAAFSGFVRYIIAYIGAFAIGLTGSWLKSWLAGSTQRASNNQGGSHSETNTQPTNTASQLNNESQGTSSKNSEEEFDEYAQIQE